MVSQRTYLVLIAWVVMAGSRLYTDRVRDKARKERIQLIDDTSEEKAPNILKEETKPPIAPAVPAIEYKQETANVNAIFSQDIQQFHYDISSQSNY